MVATFVKRSRKIWNC